MTEGDLTIAGRTDPATPPRQAERTSFRAGAANRRLVVISNRVTPTGGARPDSGGLAVAIRAALQHSGGMWFGWSGEVSDAPSGEPAIVADGPLTFATLNLSQKDFNEYYTGFSNRVLWPLFHFRSSLVEFSRRYLNGYLRVNRMFARVSAGPPVGPRLSSDPPRRRASEAGSDAADRIFPSHPLSAGRIASGAAEPPGRRKVAVCL
jgi:hypothetical protein